MVDDLLPLDEAAKQIPGATRQTLLRKARDGKLNVYRVGKSYVTTRADLDAMVKACRVVRRDVQAEPNVALEAARQTARGLKARVRKKR